VGLVTRRGLGPVVALGLLTLAHFDFGLADEIPSLAGLPGPLVWHGGFCLVAAAVFRGLLGPQTPPSQPGRAELQLGVSPAERPIAELELGAPRRFSP
jgi:hypothetical protein